MNEQKKVEYTNRVPICPFCYKPTIRLHKGGESTAMTSSEYTDEQGNTYYYDPNTYYSRYECQECDNTYCVATRQGEEAKYV